MKLFTSLGSFRGNKVLVAAHFVGAQIEPVYLESHRLQEPELLQKNPNGTIPILETENGCLFESNAILRYVGGLNPGLSLLGDNNWHRAQVNQWIDWSVSQLEPPIHQLTMSVYGWIDTDNVHLNRAANEAIQSLQILDKHLKLNSFVVGNSITIADIAIASLLVNSMRFLLDEPHRKDFISVTRWFESIANQVPFKKVWGVIHLCKTPFFSIIKKSEESKGDKKVQAKDRKKSEGQDQIKVEVAAKDQKKVEKGQKKADVAKVADKKVQEATKQEDDEDKPVEKSEKNPLDALPPSTFNLFDFKTLFVNAPNKKDALDFFWKNYDPKGYSLYHIEYQKAEGEGKVLFLTNNLKNGFLQRLDHFRKYAFGVHGVYGDEPNLQIRGAWVWRGEGTPNEIKELDSYEYHTWTRLDEKKPEDRKRIEEYWTGLTEGDVVDGLVARDVNYFK